MAQDIVLDEATKQRLADEVERLVRMDMDRKKARRVVWEDYLDELVAYAAPAPTPEPEPPLPEPSPPETPVPEPPSPPSLPVTKPVQAKPKERFFTPERLERNRVEIQKMKQFLASRRTT